MSLYNALFGENPAAAILLAAIGLTREKVPRYRDVYLVREDDEMRIVVHTRTGGGNREYYDSQKTFKENNSEDDYAGPFNDDLRQLPTFVKDEDMAFDPTYANFTFTIPPAFQSIIDTLIEMGKGEIGDPETRWKNLFDALKKDEQTADVKRAEEVGKAILEQIDANKDNPGIKVIEV